jgi:hypothetical protein
MKLILFIVVSLAIILPKESDIISLPHLSKTDLVFMNIYYKKIANLRFNNRFINVYTNSLADSIVLTNSSNIITGGIFSPKAYCIIENRYIIYYSQNSRPYKSSRGVINFSTSYPSTETILCHSYIRLKLRNDSVSIDTVWYTINPVPLGESTIKFAKPKQIVD